MMPRKNEHCRESPTATAENEQVNRRTWAAWGQSVPRILNRHISRITEAVANPETKLVFDAFLEDMRTSIDTTISAERAIELLAQHAITAPVFDALFADYAFAKTNAVSVAMNKILTELEKTMGLSEELDDLKGFYESVRMRAQIIDNAVGRQKVIIELYNTFFRTALPTVTQKLGIVYTPVEVVDFIIHSVNDVLQAEFGRKLTDENVNIFDPFTGTGTFITRLIESGLIDKKDLPRKYATEIFANELVLLAYYIGCVNIENAYHDAVGGSNYVPFEGMAWTDTFQSAEDDKGINSILVENSERVRRQNTTPITVILGNPPYSAGQRSANDNAQNRRYPHIDHAIKHTYVAMSNAVNKNSLYDSYIRAFRYATDRLRDGNGIVCFVTNAGWLDGNAAAGFRKCLEREFSRIYVINLRGSGRISGDARCRDGEPVFAASSLGGGSKCSVSVALLVRRSGYTKKAEILYCAVEDNLSRLDKLSLLQRTRSFLGPDMAVAHITPNEYGDWISSRNLAFPALLPLSPDKTTSSKSLSVFTTYVSGVQTNRDAWVYSFSRQSVVRNVRKTVEFYNSQIGLASPSTDPTMISWTGPLLESAKRGIPTRFEPTKVSPALYRPFSRHHLYHGEKLVHRPRHIKALFPTNDSHNLIICVSGIGVPPQFSCLISSSPTDMGCLGMSQCYPLFQYERQDASQISLISGSVENPTTSRTDGISDFILNRAQQQYHSGIAKEDIFYYVYGLLHSSIYRVTFADDLKKSLPRIPLLDSTDDFWAFSNAGRDLAHLHLNYEQVPPLAQVVVKGVAAYELEKARQAAIIAQSAAAVAAPGSYFGSPTEAARLRVTKMKFPAKNRKDTIVYNSHITIQNIPAQAYEYVVNGKSAIEWIIDRYQIRTDKDSGIVNDPNMYGEELGQPYYILNLLLSVIAVSVRTQEIVSGLPDIDWNNP